ncbi:MAG: hypothetical protein JST16_10945 [Bdellovibrionales bacterium]|nr:hypothetical protein [Bdellovibrionales bacterium]
MSSKKLLGSYGRSVSGYVIAGLVWLFIGWALSSLALGSVLAAWSLVIGPLLVPAITWNWMRWRHGLRRLDIAKDTTLAREFFALILSQRGPNPEVWMHPSEDLGLLWFERLGLRESRQIVVVSQMWLQRPAELKVRDWRRLWNEIHSLSKGERFLRSWQIRLWAGALGPCDALLYGLELLLSLFGVSDLPSPGFWFQRVAWHLRELWFGLPPDYGTPPLPDQHSPLITPDAWNSVVWGPWFQIPPESCHPAWWLLTHRSAMLSTDTGPDSN